MNCPCRTAALALAAFLISSSAITASAAPAGQLSLHWSQLPPVLEGRSISVHLPDGATVEGKYAGLQSDALLLDVTKTSDPAKHPKGTAKLARTGLTQLVLMRKSGWKGRIIGLIAGSAASAMIAGAIHAKSNNEVGGWNSSTAGVAAAATAGAVGIGYLAGWAADSARARPEQLVQILPDDTKP